MAVQKLMFLLLFCMLTLAVKGQTLSEDPGEKEILIRLKKNVQIKDVLQRINTSSFPKEKVKYVQQVGKRFNIHLLEINPEKDNVWTTVDWLNTLPEIVGAQPNAKVEFRLTPDDPDYILQWGIERIGVDRVWDVTTGGLTANGDTIVVAILDSGYDLTHEDIVNNLWRNPGEIPGDGIDNDANGFIDDVHGYDFPKESGMEYTLDDHGLSVAGIIGAQGDNGIGVSGINWTIKLMLFTIDSSQDVVDAYEYIVDQRDRYNNSNGTDGAFVVATNASFGITGRFCSEFPVWGAMYDELGEVGVLTGGAPANTPWDVDINGDMPTTCPSNFLISILNVTMDDKKYQGSSFGAESIDFGSPGQESYSTKPFDQYGPFGSNSAAAPHLTGAIALLYSLPCTAIAEGALEQPKETALFIREVLMNGVDPLADLEGITVTGGRLNAYNSMQLISEACGGTNGPLDIMKIYPVPTRDQLTIEYETPDFEAYDIRVFNALGQLVFRNNLQPGRFGTKKETINTSFWARGVYFISLQRGEDRVIKKLLVQ